MTSCLPARAQLALPPDADIFGDGIVRKFDANGNGPIEVDDGADPQKPKRTGLEHTLVFQDGRQLRGELVELTKSEILWRLPDASELLHFKRDEVRRVALVQTDEHPRSRGRGMNDAAIQRYVQEMVQQLAQGVGGMIGEAATQLVTQDLGRAVRIPNVIQVMSQRMVASMKQMERGENGEPSETEQKPAVRNATLKLPGGDWLFGEVTSADGETFSLKLADGTVLAIPRAPIEWLHFGTAPAPAYGFAGSVLDLESWTARTPGSRLEVAGGTLTLRDGRLLGRSLKPPKRFEVAFEVPEENESGLRLWLQPHGPQTNSYSRGTVLLVFGKKEISHCIYMNKLERKKSPVPQESAGQKGPVTYRVLYDGSEKHLVVLRNGVPLGDWKLEEDQEESNGDREFTITGLCFDRENGVEKGVLKFNLNGLAFDRENGDEKGVLKFNRLRVQPWDGVVPQAGEVVPAGDRLSAASERPMTGQLESISADALVFSGATKKREEGTFVRLHEAAPSLAGAEAVLIFGPQGEVSAADLEIRDGRARGRTGFAATLDLPTTALQTLAFPSHPVNAEKPADALVFKNGDALRGTLLTATAGGVVRWKMAGGQELNLQSERIAGVRIAAGAEVRKSEDTATVELRNGDRLRGGFTGLDAKTLEFQHPQLGALQIARERLWSLYPNPRFPIGDGGSAAAPWSAARPTKTASEDQPPPTTRWTVLDGSYLDSGAGGSGSDEREPASLNVPIKEIPERFELRAEATDVTGNPPSFSVTLGTKDHKTSLQISLNYYNLSLYARSPKARQQNNNKNVQLRGKVPDVSSRLALRVFVDRTAGTADLFLNGAIVARVGQQVAERLPGFGEVVSLNPGQQEGTTSILSNLWIGPWNGELPRPSDGVPATTALTNGDSAPGVPVKWEDGKFFVETAAGNFDVPLEKVQAIEFGGAMTPEKTPARIRLADGSAVSVESFRWEGGELTAHSAALGDLRLPTAAVSELIFNPAPLRPPRSPVVKKLAQKTDGEAAKVNSAVIPRL